MLLSSFLRSGPTFFRWLFLRSCIRRYRFVPHVATKEELFLDSEKKIPLILTNCQKTSKNSFNTKAARCFAAAVESGLIFFKNDESDVDRLRDNYEASLRHVSVTRKNINNFFQFFWCFFFKKSFYTFSQQIMIFSFIFKFICLFYYIIMIKKPNFHLMGSYDVTAQRSCVHFNEASSLWNYNCSFVCWSDFGINKTRTQQHHKVCFA